MERERPIFRVSFGGTPFWFPWLGVHPMVNVGGVDEGTHDLFTPKATRTDPRVPVSGRDANTTECHFWDYRVASL